MADLVGVSSWCGKHGFDGGSEVGEGLDERDNAFPLLDLDFGVFNAADLFFGKAVESADESTVNFG